MNEFIYKLNRPCVFKNILVKTDTSNSAIDWTPTSLESILKNEKLTFRIGKKQRECVQFENECQYIEATINEFNEWSQSVSCDKNSKKRKLTNSNPFEKYDQNEYWAYADYKYMIELLKSNENSIQDNCIDWSKFGFSKRNANETTLWIGTKDAYTPCHFDTYGYNLVAQIYGTKRWIMFPQEDSQFMYPSRIPFEESTVYSQINIKSPNLKKFSNFEKSRPYIVEIEPGDVLYVPHNWWHYVESISDITISLNSWIDLETEDNYSRLKEILSKTLLQSVMESNLISFEKWINSSEDYVEQEANMSILKETLAQIELNENKLEKAKDLDYKSLVETHSNFKCFVEPIQFRDFIENYTLKQDFYLTKDDDDDNLVFRLAKAVTNPNTIDLIAQNFLKSK